MRFGSCLLLQKVNKKYSNKKETIKKFKKKKQKRVI